MTLLYIAGPMSSIPDFNYPAFRDAERRLREVGHDVLSPTHVKLSCGCTGGVDLCGTKHTWSDYMRVAIQLLMLADGVAALEDWSRSRGARLEVMVARRLGMDVELVDYWLGAL